MARLRNPWFVLALGGALLVLAGVAAAFGGPGERWRRWRWTTIAATPLDEAERATLEACDTAPGWSVWLKILHTDPELPCGEAWAATSLAEHASHDLRATWLSERLADPEASTGTRMRAATGLLLAGRTPAQEPAWLWLELPDPRAAAWVDAASVPAVGPQLGPAVGALAATRALETGDPRLTDAVPMLRWLAETGEPRALAEVELAVTRATAVDADLARQLAERRSRGLPIGRPPIPGRAILAGGCTGPTCLPERLQVLEVIAADPGEPPPTESGGQAEEADDPDLERLVGAGARELAWQLLALRSWIAAAPDPDARLASLLSRPATGPLGRLAWDGSGPPHAVAWVARSLRSPPPTVRSARADGVVVELGDRSVLRTCSAGAVASEGWPELPPDPLLARAWMELAGREPTVRARARHLDPSLAAPEVTGDPLAFRIGAMLAPPPRDPIFDDEGWCVQ